jgi:hypothetical protein
MVIEGFIGMQQIQSAYSYLHSVKRKERFDVILEPLQAITQLAYLKACPIGTKLTIENNLLFIQIPNWHQGITRSWNKDKREDILLLFNAVQRYNKMYVNNHSKNENPIFKNLIEIITRMAIEGIDNLISTYSRVENTSIVQTLVMYKTILSYPERFNGIDNLHDEDEENEEYSSTSNNKSNHKNNSNNSGNSNSNSNKSNKIIHKTIQNNSRNSNDRKMEDVFAQIRNNWNDNEIAVLYNILCLIDSDKINAEMYINGANQILKPLHDRIRKWISDNIVY